MNFGAVILAGGKSSRMGRDKAFLEIGGQSLLARQISLAREIGAAEIFISGRMDVDYSALNSRVLTDELPDLGPLAGIAAALTATHEPLLLVLAVDMANMNGEFLKKLHAQCQNGIGVVPLCARSAGGSPASPQLIIEPLAAFYPKAACELAQKLLAGTNQGTSPGAKHFAESCVQVDLARFVSTSPDEAELFKSWNSLADLPP
jgi:molybdopterin-guanine dinucleotide biosynthesis protein A